MVNIMYYINYFFIFSVLGHTVESILSKTNDSGILLGFWTPIYGIGTIVILLLNNYIRKTTFNKLLKIITLFICSSVLLSTIEMIGGYLIKFIFNRELWNYTNQIFNIGKYASLEMALVWGISSIILIYIIKPIIDKLVVKIPKFISYIFVAMFCIDLLLSLALK